MATNFVRVNELVKRKELNQATIECEGYITSLARKFNGSCPGHQNEDLIQLARIRAWEALVAWDPARKAAIKSMIFKYINSALINLIEKENAQKRGSGNPPKELEQQLERNLPTHLDSYDFIEMEAMRMYKVELFELVKRLEQDDSRMHEEIWEFVQYCRGFWGQLLPQEQLLLTAAIDDLNHGVNQSALELLGCIETDGVIFQILPDHEKIMDELEKTLGDDTTWDSFDSVEQVEQVEQETQETQEPLTRTAKKRGRPKKVAK